MLSLNLYNLLFGTLMHKTSFQLFLLSILMSSIFYAEDIKLDMHHPNIESVKLFAKSPGIVTPIGIAVAPDGRVFVQENHTHKRKNNYQGPKTDRILVFEDTNGDGLSDKRSVFYEGHIHSTDLLFSAEGHLYVSTRWYIGRFLNAADKATAEGDPEIIVKCETKGDYPHNGVGGLAIDPANPEYLAFGFGENLGADYTFVGSDGVKLSGGGEGGSTYLCKTDGSNLIRQSTGHWNAFGMAYDLKGNLFSTDNDPSSTPPNRLLHIIKGADFGYEYRYGRSGRHPLVTWYGDNPGTLAMAGALGEAACGVTSFGPNKLLTASWTDNRIDIHPLKVEGETIRATRQKFISGPDNFRPVHFAYSADGKSLYFTDWVNLSYPVHGAGRVWKVSFKKPIQLKPQPRSEQKTFTIAEAYENLDSQDRYMSTRAIQTLVDHPTSLNAVEYLKDSSPLKVAHFAIAMKRHAPHKNSNIIPQLLEHSNEDVRFVAIKWIADEKLVRYKKDLEKQLNRKDLNHKSLQAVVAALSYIEGTTKGEFSVDTTMMKLVLDLEKPISIRALALQSMNPNTKSLTLGKLEQLSKNKSMLIKKELVQSLVIRKNESESFLLADIAEDKSIPGEIRADAIAGLMAFGNKYSNLLNTLKHDKDKKVAEEVDRSLGILGLSKRDLGTKPAPNDITA